ncbi:MAG: PQQ-dependent sugar dehydrogenase [Gemmatimonadaceae bacterium]
MHLTTLFCAAAALLACSPDATAPTMTPTSTVLKLETVATGLNSPLYVTAPAGDARLFVVEQTGRVRIVANGQLLAAPFLDVSARISSGGERGLLSIAFHPRYATNGLFFLYFTDPAGDLRIERQHVSADANVADASSAALVLAVPHQLASNHNGGLLLFGPDGMLYAGLGDGGGAGDPTGNAQNRAVLLGKLLRLDVDGGSPYRIPPDNPFAGVAGARGEIWAYGLRNPWRYAFDRVAGDLYIADVGQSEREEVDVVRAAAAGVNYGWNRLEGTRCYGSAMCSTAGVTLPVFEYDHTQGCSITGGFVYRGTRIAELAGTYFFSDYCSGGLRSMRVTGGTVSEEKTWPVTTGSVTSFGEDATGELYLTTTTGTVYRIARG